MVIKKSLEKIGRIGLASLIGVLPMGCRNDLLENKEGNYAGFEAVSLYWHKDYLQILLKDANGHWVDGRYSPGKDEFYSIEIASDIGRIPQNNPLWKYANPDSLKAVDRALRTEE